MGGLRRSDCSAPFRVGGGNADWLAARANPTIGAVPGKPTVIEPSADASGLRIAVVVSRYNRWITDRLQDGAVAEFLRLGGTVEDLVIIAAPGTFELPSLVSAASAGRDAVVALGCVIKGETRHDAVIADAVAAALADFGARTATPALFGVLTVDSEAQAEARAQPVYETDDAAGETSGKRTVDNKGVETMRAAIEAARAIRGLRELESTGR